MKKLSTLYHKGKDGSIRVWTITTKGSKVITTYGHLDGEMITSSYECEPKNVGRSNETSAIEQAKKEALAMWTHKQDLKYSQSPEEAEETLSIPMLAKTYKDSLDVINWYAQPKLDGCRALAYWLNGHVVLQSRGCKFYIVPEHIIKDLESWLPKDSTLDGELYIHGMSCQQLTSLVKKKKDGSEKVQYWIYDYPIVRGNESLPFSERIDALSKLLYDPTRTCRRVQTVLIKDISILEAYEQSCIEAGYEGVMLRDPTSLYLFGYRSEGLLKLKRFLDAEFKVIDCSEGIGKFKGLAIFICACTDEEKTFEVAAPGTFEERALIIRQERNL